MLSLFAIVVGEVVSGPHKMYNMCSEKFGEVTVDGGLE